MHFLNLPRTRATKLNEEYSEDEFIEGNLFNSTDSLNDHLAERKLGDWLTFARLVPEQQLKDLKAKATPKVNAWKTQTH